LGDVAGLAARGGLKLEYPLIEGVTADLVLVTHEHADRNGVDSSTASVSRTSATSGSARCATSRPRRSARSTSSSCR
jgi:hypothetical protein